MKKLLLILGLVSVMAYAVTENTGKFDNLTTNDPAKTTIDLKKNVDIQSTGGLYLPLGTTGERPAPTKAGMLRYNSTDGSAEIFDGLAWGAVGGGGGISLWVPLTDYAADDIVVETNRIYRSLDIHTSSASFIADALHWIEVSATDLSVASGTLATASGGTGSTNLGTGFIKGNAGALSATSSVSLITDVSGTLPVLNGGTGSTTGALAGDIAGTLGATTYNNTVPTTKGGTGSTNLGTGILKATAGTIATGSVSLITDVTGTVAIGNGGTGTTTAPLARIALGTEQAFDGLEYTATVPIGSDFGTSFNTTTGVMTVTHSANAHSAWIGGVKFDKTSAGVETCTVNLTDGKKFIYYNASGVLTCSDSAWDISAIGVAAPLEMLHLDNTSHSSVNIAEKHKGPSGMDAATHFYMHTTKGTQVTTGAAIANTAASLPSTDKAFTVSLGQLADEDNLVAIAAVTSSGANVTTSIKKFYRKGASSTPASDNTKWQWTDSTTPYLTSGSDLAYDDGSGVLKPLGSAGASRYMNYYIVLIPTISGQAQVGMIVGQKRYGALATAQSENPAVDIANYGDLTNEMVFVARLTYRGTALATTTTLESLGLITINTVAASGAANFVDLSSNQTVGGNKAFSGSTIFGDNSFESIGVSVNGTTSQSTVKTSDIGGTNPYQSILHRHSTTLAPMILGARSNSEDSTHVSVTNTQKVLALDGSGYVGNGTIDATNNYKLFGQIDFEVDGTPSTSSSPGKLLFNTTASGTTSPILAATIDSTQTAKFEKPIKGTLNDNLLVNPNFESALGSEWVASGTTIAITTTSGEYSEGAQGLKMTTPSSGVELINVQQNVATVSGAISQHVVGTNYKWLATDIIDFTICSMVNGSEQTCVPTASLIGDNVSHTIEIPTTATAGQTIGIKYKSSTNAVSKNAYADRAYIKAGIGTQALQLAQQTSRTASLGTNVSGTAANIRFDTANRVEYGSGVISITDDGTYTRFTALQDCTVVLGAVAPVNSTNNLQIYLNASTRVSYVSMADATADYSQVVFNGKLNAGDYLTVRAIATLRLAFGEYHITATPIASSSVYSQASANYDWTSYTPTITGSSTNNTPSNACKHKRNGGDLEVSCSWTMGTVSAAYVSISLPNSLTIDTTKILLANLETAAGQIVGSHGTTGGVNNTGYVVTATGTSTSKVYFANYYNNASALLPELGTQMYTGGTVSAYFKVPISGWSNAATIVGSFAGVPSVPGYQGSVDTFSVSYGNTTTTDACTGAGNCYIDQLGEAGGTADQIGAVKKIVWNSTGNMTMTTNKTYSKLKCVASGGTTAGSGSLGIGTVQLGSLQCSSCSTLTFTTFGASPISVIDTAGNLLCQGTPQ